MGTSPLLVIWPERSVTQVTYRKIQLVRRSGEGAEPPGLIRRLLIRAFGLIAMP